MLVAVCLGMGIDPGFLHKTDPMTYLIANAKSDGLKDHAKSDGLNGRANHRDVSDYL